jgi:hypothetical protein
MISALDVGCEGGDHNNGTPCSLGDAIRGFAGTLSSYLPGNTLKIGVILFSEIRLQISKDMRLCFRKMGKTQ